MTRRPKVGGIAVDDKSRPVQAANSTTKFRDAAALATVYSGVNGR